MKKLMILLLVCVFIVGVASSAFAGYLKTDKRNAKFQKKVISAFKASEEDSNVSVSDADENSNGYVNAHDGSSVKVSGSAFLGGRKTRVYLKTKAKRKPVRVPKYYVRRGR